MKKGKPATAARKEAKVKRRAKRKAKLNALLISKIRPLLIKMEQMKAKLKFQQKEGANGSEEGNKGQA